MVLQQAVELYVVIDGVERPVKPEVGLIDQLKLDVRRYTQNPENGVVDLDDSRTVNAIAHALRHAKSDRFTSLAQAQPLVRGNKVPLDAMRESLGKFYDELWSLRKDYWIWAELMDSQPNLRGLEFPNGKDAFLYRGAWKVNADNTIDISAMDPERDFVAVTRQRGRWGHNMSKEWEQVTGASELVAHFPDELGKHGIHHYPTDSYLENALKGLYVLRWGFKTGLTTLVSDERPHSKTLLMEGVTGFLGLLNIRPIVYEAPFVAGALLGSRRGIDEIVEKSYSR